MAKVVLITGCSTGIGRDLAQRLAQAGYEVAATARKVETLQDLPAALKLPLDVTDPLSVDQAVACTLERFGRIDVLVNNAGYALRGAIEEVPIAEVQRMFEANLFGALRMVQAVAPAMRRQRRGRIIHISSIAGLFSTPANGSYSATKFALEAISDALRWELASFGIQVILVEPGAIRTQFLANADRHAGSILTNPSSPYAALYRQAQQVGEDMGHGAPGPEAVSRVIQQAMETARPKARYQASVPASARLVQLLGASFWDLAVRRLFKITDGTSI